MTCATNYCICWPTILPLTMRPWDSHKDGSKSHCGSDKHFSIPIEIYPTAHLPYQNRGGKRCSLRRHFLRLPWCWQG